MCARNAIPNLRAWKQRSQSYVCGWLSTGDGWKCFMCTQKPVSLLMVVWLPVHRLVDDAGFEGESCTFVRHISSQPCFQAWIRLQTEASLVQAQSRLACQEAHASAHIGSKIKNA